MRAASSSRLKPLDLRISDLIACPEASTRNRIVVVPVSSARRAAAGYSGLGQLWAASITGATRTGTCAGAGAMAATGGGAVFVTVVIVVAAGASTAMFTSGGGMNGGGGCCILGGGGGGVSGGGGGFCSSTSLVSI